MRSVSQKAAPTAKLGIIAGGGDLPGRLVDACRARGCDTFVLAYRGVGKVESVRPDAWVDIGRVGDTFAALHAAECKEVVLAGPIQRPTLSALKLDKRGRAILAKLARVWGRDDALLSLIVSELEAQGFRVVGADDVLRDLLAVEGPLTRLGPDEQAKKDIELGVEVITALGTLDIAQAVVVQAGRVLGIEAAEGTDSLIDRCGELKADDRVKPVLVKLQKPGQERRVDLPAVGAETVIQAAAAGFSGIAIEAGGTLVMDREALILHADKLGLFVIAITPTATSDTRNF